MKSENNLTSRQLVSLIHNTEWIDLSEDHKSLRKDLENYIENSCVKKIGESPVMVKGAFGIGKTAFLNYLFHYGWTELNIPVFQMDLSEIISILREYNNNNGLEKTPNEDVGKIIGNSLKKQIQLLKDKDFSKIQGGELSFPGFKKENSNLTDYLRRFECASLYSSDNGKFESKEFEVFDSKVIDAATKENTKCLLLIDEFEAKYHELKNIIEISGGGILRAFFDHVTDTSSDYYCIIANGPTSGYELSKDTHTNTSRSSDAADQRRIFVKQIFTPTVKSLSETFLKTYDKNHINFYWWLSRARPGQIKLLKESLRPFEELQNNSYIDFITKNDVLKNQVDDMGESNVPLLKSELLENLNNTKLQNKIKDLLISLGPSQMDVSEKYWKDLIAKNSDLFYVSKKLIEKDEIIDALLHKDISKKIKEKSIDKNILHKYLDLILSSMSDADDKIAIGTIIKKGDFHNSVSQIIYSVLKMVDDFISIYEDETDTKIKSLLDFLRDLINTTDEFADIWDEFEATYALIEDNSIEIRKEESLYIQLSLHSIREIIEQPIGSPRLNYKNESLEDIVSEINSFDRIIMHNDSENEIIFIPVFSNEDLFKSYVDMLKDYLGSNWHEGRKYYRNGRIITSIVYFKKNEIINDFKKWLYYGEDAEGKMELPCLLKKISCVNIKEFQLNNSQRLSDFINSLCGIGVAGFTKGELTTDALCEYDHDEIIYINKIINKIVDPTWTEKKQIRRTITYYRDLLLSGENSAFNSILKQGKQGYLYQISHEFKGLGDVQKFSNSILADDISHFDIIKSKPTKNFISLLLADHRNIDKEVLNILSNVKKLSLRGNGNGISLKESYVFLNTHKKHLSQFIEDYSGNGKQFKSLRKYIKLFADQTEIEDTESFIKYLDDENPIIDSYLFHLKYSKSKKYFLHGIYFSELLNSINMEVFSKKISEDLNQKDDKIKSLTYEISELHEELKELIGEKDDFFYNKNLIDYRTKILIPCKTVNEKTNNGSLKILIHCVLHNFESVIQETQLFKNQLERLVKIVSSYKNKINEKQDEVVKLYDEGGLTVNLFNVRYPQGRNNHYFYKNIFRPSFKNTGDSFSNIFSQKYHPGCHFSITDTRIEEFEKTLEEFFIKKEPEMDETIGELKMIKNQVDQVAQVEKCIDDLIRTV